MIGRTWLTRGYKSDIMNSHTGMAKFKCAGSLKPADESICYWQQLFIKEENLKKKSARERRT